MASFKNVIYQFFSKAQGNRRARPARSVLVTLKLARVPLGTHRPILSYSWFYVYECLLAYMYAMCMSDAYGGQKSTGGCEPLFDPL